MTRWVTIADENSAIFIAASRATRQATRLRTRWPATSLWPSASLKWAWGSNSYGQVGNGTTTDRYTPVQVSNLSGVVAIAGGAYHSVALKGDGTLRAWGHNAYGELGDGTTTSRSTPVEVLGVTGIGKLAAGWYHNLVGAAGETTLGYGYDRLYRLTGVSGSSSASYGYDPAGNRSTKGGTSYSYDRADRITAAGTTGYTVDANGNLTARGTDSFGYDQANRLKTASVGGTSSTYLYDGDGKRASKTVGGTPTNYVYDVNASLPVLLDDGTRKYVWGLGLAFAVDASGSPIVYHTDGLGSVRALTDGSGAVVQTYLYDEYGNALSSSGSITQPFQFTGEQRDETGLMYLRARMYDPAIGRLLQADPLRTVGPGGMDWNRFTYAADDPAGSADPSGLRTYFIGGTGGSTAAAFSSFVDQMRGAGIRDVRGPVQAYDKWGEPINWALVNVYGLCPSCDVDASNLAQKILKDPVPDGEQLNIIGLSGGATTAFNAARVLGRRGVRVDHLATLGGVVFGQNKPRNVGTWTEVVGLSDPIAEVPFGRGAVRVELPGVGHLDYVGTPAQRSTVISKLIDQGVR